ncbi:MAG: hypothetical protein ACI4MG_00875 [Aristaeellaceae bacterium]
MIRKITILLAVALAFLMTAANADALLGGAFTDVPTAMTQDSVLDTEADEGCSLTPLEPDDASVALLQSVYDFVWRDGNRPVRYYDALTQQEIERLAEGVDIDALIMTEAMRLQLAGAPEGAVHAQMLLDVDYQPGQTVIAVLGIPQADGTYAWYPYRAEVQTLGQIEWGVPAEDWQRLCEQPVIFHVLSDRFCGRGDIVYYSEIRLISEPVFSKDSYDVIVITEWDTASGEPIGEDFRVWLEPLTQTMQDEVARMSEHIAAKGAILDWFPAERVAEAKLMLPADVVSDELIAYDIVALRCEGYKEPYGDVNTEIRFSTSYSVDKRMIVLAGFPSEDKADATAFEWYVLQAEALGGQRGVIIGLKQLTLTRMEQEPMMLIVLSEPVD